jgi:transglutaminase-like putative cysteine protease
MIRTASAHLDVSAASPAQLIFSVAISDPSDSSETLTVTQGGDCLAVRELVDNHNTRLHVVDVGAGPVTLDYEVDSRAVSPAAPVFDVDIVRYLRPSRYCESDQLGPTARVEFAGLYGVDLLAAVSSWVGQRLSYVPGSSLPTDGAVRTLLARQGVCRDYAHLVVALLRAVDVPARLVSVYAPGLSPMDFHAVAEAYVDGAWRVVDATTLAPRQSLMRIATGRDASDTAFLSTRGGAVSLTAMTVTAIVDSLPADDVRDLVRLR